MVPARPDGAPALNLPRRLFSGWNSVSDFSAIRYAKFNSALIRKGLSCYFQAGRVYRIPFGPLRGLRIRYDRPINFHVMLGLWELQNFRFLHKVLVESKVLSEVRVVCDVGANLGIYSMWFSRVLSGNATIYAFEPAPYPASRLEDTLSLNRLGNIALIQYACHDRPGNVEFFLGHHHHSSSLDPSWAGEGKGSPQRIVVRATTFDDFFCGEQERPAPDFIKLDIEGGATRALKACCKCVQQKRPLFFVESHTPEEDRAISDLVTACDYRAFRVTNSRWVEEPHDTHPNPQGIWGTLLLYPAERHREFGPAIAGFCEPPTAKV